MQRPVALKPALTQEPVAQETAHTQNQPIGFASHVECPHPVCQLFTKYMGRHGAGMGGAWLMVAASGGWWWLGQIAGATLPASSSSLLMSLRVWNTSPKPWNGRPRPWSNRSKPLKICSLKCRAWWPCSGALTRAGSCIYPQSDLYGMAYLDGFPGRTSTNQPDDHVDYHRDPIKACPLPLSLLTSFPDESHVQPYHNMGWQFLLPMATWLAVTSRSPRLCPDLHFSPEMLHYCVKSRTQLQEYA